MKWDLDQTLTAIETGFLWYFTSINLIYIVFLLLGSFKIFSRIKEIKEENPAWILSSNSLPEILFIIPMYNESQTIMANINNLLNLSYRYKKIIAVNDGSDDETFEILKKELQLIEIPKYYLDTLPTKEIRGVYQSPIYPMIYVIDKVRGRKFDAVNAAINAATTPFFVVLDADTFIDNSGFEALVRPILTTPNTIAVGATVRILNGCEFRFNRISTPSFPQAYLPGMQALEYLRAFLLRQGLDTINGVFIVSGAFSIFPRDLIIKAGGFAPSNGEDVEIIIRLHRIMLETKQLYRIRYLPDPIAWTTAPTKLKNLGRQRTRWHLGLLESLWYHKRMCLNPRYKTLGLAGFPFWLFGEAIEPIVEAAAFIYIIATFFLGLLNTSFLIMIIAVSFGFTALYTIFCLFIEELGFRKYPSLKSLLMLLWCNFIENLGYRQITLYWRLKSFIQLFQKRKVLKIDTEYVNHLVRKAVSKLPKK
jgi:cellulose synthase/poly-beta-1,6-N-acetylglucosamine synthase-like glycosyltransferase